MKELLQFKKGLIWFGLLLLNIITIHAQTFNLQSIQPSTIPAGATLEWHSALPVSNSNKITAVNSVSPGIYYAVYNYGTCYSNPSPFKLVKPDCPKITVDLYTAVDSTNKPGGTIITFHTVKPVTTANKITINPKFAPIGMYFVAYYDPIKDCYSLGTPIRVISDITCGPVDDINATLVNQPVVGNVSTNDHLPSNSIYGTPVAVAGNPSTSAVTMNANGTYSFVSSVPGVYVFDVPVCFPDTTIPCRSEVLTILVTDAFNKVNPPNANDDRAVVGSGSFVNINVKGNDETGNPGGSLGNPIVTTAPINGVTSVNSDGTVTYTSNAGFVGLDSFKYQICDTSLNPGLCDIATVYITVQPTSAPNSVLANDDYAKTPNNTPVSSNVVSNDIDPQSNILTVVSQNVVVPNKGNLVLGTNGNYTFTPSFGFSGSVNFVYQVCDNGIPQACATATLYIVVDPPSILNNDFNVTNVNVPVSGDMSINDVLIPDSKFGNPTSLAGNPNTALPAINSDGAYSFVTNTPGVYQFSVPVCQLGQTNCATELLTITVNNPVLPNSPPVANPDLGTTKINQPVNINVRANDDATSLGGSLDNPSVTTAPLHGTATVNPDGTIMYIPANGFTGVDTFKYMVCDTSLAIDLCATTSVIVTVLPVASPNSTFAADDYVATYGTTSVSGNAKTNDTDPDGNTQTITAQTVTDVNGQFILSTNGVYTFTPSATLAVTGGTVNYVYKTCDNGIPQACAEATIHILVDKAPDYTPQIIGSSTLYSNVDTVKEFAINISNVNGILNKSAVKFRITQVLPNKVIMVDTNVTSIVFNGAPFNVNNNLWTVTLIGATYEFTLKPNVTIPADGSLFVGFKLKIPQNAPASVIQNLSVSIVAGSGGDNNVLNNTNAIKISKN